MDSEPRGIYYVDVDNVDGPQAMNLKGRPLSGEPEAMNLAWSWG